MKKLLSLCLLVLSLSSKAQINVTKGADGKYHSVTSSKKSSKVQASGTLYVDKDSTIHTIYVTSTGKYYIVRKSKKTGKEYKQYLKLES